MEATLDAFRDAIRQAGDSRAPLRLRGGGSKDFYGQALVGTVLDTRPHAGIVDYDPAELVVTARCGTPLAEIEAALAERRQMLAFEPPHFAAPGIGHAGRRRGGRAVRPAPAVGGRAAGFRARRAADGWARRGAAFRRAGHEERCRL